MTPIVIALLAGLLLGYFVRVITRPSHTRPLMHHLIVLANRVYAPALDEPQRGGIQPKPLYYLCRMFFWDAARYISRSEREELLQAINKVHEARGLPPFSFDRREWEKTSGEHRSVAIFAG